MSIQGKWRIVEMPDYEPNFPDMMGPAYILFDKTGGEFAFGCVTGAIHGTVDGVAVEFSWSGNDEMDEACGDGWAKLKMMAPSKDRFASKAAMKPTSLPSLGRLLQQPARASIYDASN